MNDTVVAGRPLPCGGSLPAGGDIVKTIFLSDAHLKGAQCGSRLEKGIDTQHRLSICSSLKNEFVRIDGLVKSTFSPPLAGGDEGAGEKI